MKKEKTLTKTEQTMTNSSETEASNLLKNCRQPLIHRLARTLWALKPAYEKELGVSGPGFLILSLLSQQDGLTQNDLTSLVRVDASIITRMVKHLEHELGWITRERDAQDNRLMRVFLTKEGRQQMQGLDEKEAVLEQRLTHKLTQAELVELDRMLSILEETARNEYEGQKPN